jgi:ketopantoate reductase
MELEAVVGAVIELGERLDIQMPSTRAVYACAALLTERISAQPAAGSRTLAVGTGV